MALCSVAGRSPKVCLRFCKLSFGWLTTGVPRQNGGSSLSKMPRFFVTILLMADRKFLFVVIDVLAACREQGFLKLVSLFRHGTSFEPLRNEVGREEVKAALIRDAGEALFTPVPAPFTGSASYSLDLVALTPFLPGRHRKHYFRCP